MTHEFRPIAGDEHHQIYVIQPQSLDEDGRFQKIVPRNPVYTHRPMAKWIQAKRPRGVAWELVIYMAEIALPDVAKASENFEKLGEDSLRWLVGRHGLKLVEPPRAAGDDKMDRSARGIMLRAVREFFKSDAGKTAKPLGATSKEKPVSSEIPVEISDMDDGELEEAAAMLGVLPAKWNSMRRDEKEAVYAKALAKKKELQEATA